MRARAKSQEAQPATQELIGTTTGPSEASDREAGR
jgi:hypothetical protein